MDGIYDTDARANAHIPGVFFFSYSMGHDWDGMGWDGMEWTGNGIGIGYIGCTILQVYWLDRTEHTKFKDEYDEVDDEICLCM